MLNVIGCLETNLLHRQGCYCCPSDSEKGAEIQALWDHIAKKKSQNEMGTRMLQSFWLKSVSPTCPASHYRDSLPRDCIIWCLSIASSGVLCILVTAHSWTCFLFPFVTQMPSIFNKDWKMPLMPGAQQCLVVGGCWMCNYNLQNDRGGYTTE